MCFFESNWNDRSPVADEEVSCPCPGPRFCALSGAAALPDQEKLPFLSFFRYCRQKSFCTLSPAEKYLYFVLLFWDKPVSQAHHPLTLPFSHFETQLVCLFWSRLQVSQLEIEINIVMFSFPAVSCFWLWRGCICDIHLTSFSPNHVQHLEYIQIRILPVSLLCFCSP